MSTADPSARPIFGFYGFLFAIIAMVLVVLTMTTMFSAPKQEAATTVGEIAAEIRNSAVRALTGAEKPAPVVTPKSKAEIIFGYTSIIAPVLAGLAAVLGAFALLRREAPQLPMMAITLGISAFVMQYAFYIALFIAGICLLIAIISNIGDILGA